MSRFKNKLRIESSAQVSGSINLNRISHLKESNYYIIDVPLDGDAPKQYIKAYFYYKNCPRISRPDNWNGYYAKTGGKSYPHESIIEFTINKIGDALGLNMNKTELVVINKQVRFLSQDFLDSGKRLIHGTEILAEYFEDKDWIEEVNRNRNTRREILTFDVIEEAMIHMYPNQCHELLAGIVQMITYDALVGNNDRHFYNWGVIGDTLRSSTDSVTFAPIYDTARGLLWNIKEEKLLQMYERYKTDQSGILNYINRSKPRFSFEENPKANHFELIEYLVSYKSEYAAVVKALSSIEHQQSAVLSLKETIERLFSVERTELMVEVLNLRFEKIRNTVV